MAKHVISTLAQDQNYAQYVNVAGMNTIHKKVLVKGGAGLKIMGAERLSTQRAVGIRTTVSDEDAKFLLDHSEFQLHMKRGFVRIEDRALDADNVAVKKNMPEDTGSAPKDQDDVRREAEELAKKAKGELKPEEALRAVAGTPSGVEPDKAKTATKR